MIALLDYGAGNTASIANVLKELGCEFKITDKEIDITESEKVIFPGVGDASFAIERIRSTGLFHILREIKKPLLGICLGMQVFCEKAKEGNVDCLGILLGSTEIFDTANVKVPHMGWNEVKQISSSKLFVGIKDNEYFYFANSYYVPMGEYTTAKTIYDVEFSACIEKNNYYGVQFHPEKSGAAGTQLIKNFIELC
ncbi:MAG: imidazole glycerol phosphate synthase subunit HisH [bacterium]